MKETISNKFSVLKSAFPYTIPVMAGYLFLGASYGVLMSSRGFPFFYPIITSLLVFAGSMEFALANLLLGAFAPMEALFLALMINARHIFYGISMLEKYKGMGLKKLYLIFALTDETFSVNYLASPPDGEKRGLFYLYTSLLDHSYWVMGAAFGGIFGSLISADIKGIDFAMTAMFVVILLEQIRGGVKNLPSVTVGVAASVASLLIFGGSSFLLPAMGLMLLSLAVLKKPISYIEKREGGASD